LPDNPHLQNLPRLAAQKANDSRVMPLMCLIPAGLLSVHRSIRQPDEVGMQQHVHCHSSRTQFSLKDLFECMTFCCVMAALSGVLGIGPSLCLMGLGLALWMGQGLLALTMLMAASLAAELQMGPHTLGAFGQQLMTALAATAVCCWYRWRAGMKQRQIKLS
jgi:hypothetical protein